jgi:hypothetical protein
MNADQEMVEIERELGISGDDYDDDEFGYVENVGDADDDDDEFGYEDEVGRRRKRRRRRSKKSGRPRIKVNAPGNVGSARLWHMPATAVLSLAAAGTGNLTFTPNRNISIVDMILGVYTAAAITRAATYPEAIAITNITVQGRSQFPGAGVVPLSAFLPESQRRYGKLDWENCQAAQSVVVSFINNDAATTHIVTGCLVVRTVW